MLGVLRADQEDDYEKKYRERDAFISQGVRPGAPGRVRRVLRGEDGDTHHPEMEIQPVEFVSAKNEGKQLGEKINERNRKPKKRIEKEETGEAEAEPAHPGYLSAELCLRRRAIASKSAALMPFQLDAPTSTSNHTTIAPDGRSAQFIRNKLERN
jgi:hypothetical protein